MPGLILVVPYAYEQQKHCPGISQDNFSFDNFYNPDKTDYCFADGGKCELKSGHHCMPGRTPTLWVMLCDGHMPFDESGPVICITQHNVVIAATPMN